MISVSGTGYRELFVQPVLRRLAVADVCARLPQGMVSLTLLLVAAQHASMTVAGLVNPPLSPGLRSLWSAHTQARLTQTAFALDAAVFDLAYITGPVLASRHRLSRLLAGYAFGLGVLTGAGLYAPLLATAAPLAGLCLGLPWPRYSARRAALAGVASARPVLALGVAAAAAVAAAGAAGMHHAPFGKNDRRDRGGAVPWLPGPTGGQA